MISVSSAQHRSWIPFATVFVALVLLVIPAPELIRGFLPDWVSLVLIYWALALPDRMRLPLAWGVGLVIDLVVLGIPGVHALSKTLLVYLAKHLSLRVRAYPLWQQSVVIALLLAIELILFVIVDFVMTGNMGEVHRWTAVIVGGLVWPLVYFALRRSRHLANLGR
ncbi:MAG: rod shape-determining protein MreD [Arenicellales bacterium]